MKACPVVPSDKMTIQFPKNYPNEEQVRDRLATVILEPLRKFLLEEKDDAPDVQVMFEVISTVGVGNVMIKFTRDDQTSFLIEFAGIGNDIYRLRGNRGNTYLMLHTTHDGVAGGLETIRRHFSTKILGVV